MDPFASIIKFCIPTAEMEAKFASCPYARESEILFPPGSSTSVDQQPERHCNSSSSNPKRSSSMVRVSRLRLESERVEVVVLDEGETEAIVIDDDDEEENVKDISNGRGSGKKPKGRHANVDADADADADFDGGCKRRRVRQRGDICGKKRDLPAWGKGIPSASASASLKKKKKKRMEKEVVVENEKEKEECSSDELFELEVLKVVFDDDGGSCYCDDEYVDLILTAQEMGVELIRPRWWPPADADADGDHPDLWILWC